MNDMINHCCQFNFHVCHQYVGPKKLSLNNINYFILINTIVNYLRDHCPARTAPLP